MDKVPVTVEISASLVEYWCQFDEKGHPDDKKELEMRLRDGDFIPAATRLKVQRKLKQQV